LKQAKRREEAVLRHTGGLETNYACQKRFCNYPQSARKARGQLWEEPEIPSWTLSVGLIYSSPVPNPSKSAGQSQSAKASVPFEEALKKLEGIVEAMESDDLPLETLLAKYEEGTKLAKICQEKLAEAELKIQQLEKTAAGELKLKPFEKDLEP